MGEKEALFGYYAAIAVPEAEKFLQEQLYDVVSASETYWRSCIRALAKCGTYESINVLNEFSNRRLKREKDQAIAEIQSRIGAGDSGWLSVGKLEPEAGDLSVTAQGNDNGEKQDE